MNVRVLERALVMPAHKMNVGALLLIDLFDTSIYCSRSFLGG